MGPLGSNFAMNFGLQQGGYVFEVHEWVCV